jgi:hypothetical protein
MKNNSSSLFVRRPTWGGRVCAFRLFCIATLLVSLSSGLALAQGAPASTVTGRGTADFIPRWTGTTTIGNSNIFETVGGQVGIATTTPAAKLDVKGTEAVRDSLILIPKLAHPTLVVNGTAFAVSNTGLVTFVSGQTFPGAGTVTSVGSGLGLMGGPITTSGTLAIDPTVVPQLNTANTFTGNQTVDGNVSVVGGSISVGGSRALSCTSSGGAIGSIPNGGFSTYSTGAVPAPAGYSLTGCSAFWASDSTCGVIQYPKTANITALDGIDQACHALGYNGSGGTLESCAVVTACQLP